MRALAAIAAALLLGACSQLGAGTAAPDLFTLNPAAPAVSGGAPVDWRLAIDEPLATGGFDTNRVVAMPAPRELKYVANMRWIDAAPKMVQTLLVQSFEKSGRIRAVDRQNVSFRSDYFLKSELREFEGEYFGGATVPTVHVRILAKLVKLPRESLVDSREFEATRKAASGKPADLIAAFDDALGRVMAEIVQWTLATAAR
jgi:cholesterol transport system auxiliary component